MAGLKGQTGASMSRIERKPKHVRVEIICFKCHHCKKKDGEKLRYCDKKMTYISWDKSVLRCGSFVGRNSKKAITEENKRIEKAQAFLDRLTIKEKAPETKIKNKKQKSVLDYTGRKIRNDFAKCPQCGLVGLKFKDAKGVRYTHYQRLDETGNYVCKKGDYCFIKY